MGNIYSFICPDGGYDNFEAQFEQYQILIGLKKTDKLNELNAILQCLGHCDIILDYFKYHFKKIEKLETYKKYNNDKISLSTAFKNIIEKLWPNEYCRREGKPYMTIDDSKEFLNMIYKIKPTYNTNNEILIEFILKRLSIELYKPKTIDIIENNSNQKEIALNNYCQENKKEMMSKIGDLFYATEYSTNGQIYEFKSYLYRYYSLGEVYNYKCMTCQNGVNIFYKFIPGDSNNINQISIVDCLYYENKNQNKIIYTSPEILIFIFDKNNIPTNINFLIEENINIASFVEKKQKTYYELFGIIIYYSSTNSEKYRAYCKYPINNYWHWFEDEKFEIMQNFQEIAQRNFIPYMLFYKHKK